MPLKSCISFAAILFALAVISASSAQDKAPDRPPEADKAPRRDPRRDDERPRREGDAQSESGKAEEGFTRRGGPRDEKGPPPGGFGDESQRDGKRKFGPGGFGGAMPGAGARGGKGPREAESPAEEQIRRQSEGTLYLHDRNRDGKLDRDEWTPLKDPEKLDRNSDGYITLDELIHGPHTVTAGAAYSSGGRVSGFAGGFPGPRGEMPGGRPGGIPGMYGEGGGRVFLGGFGGYGSPERDDPEMRDLHAKDSEMERQTVQLVARYGVAKADDREKLKQEIADLVAKHFEVRQERRKLQLKRMEEELKRLREAITKRDDSSDSIVKSRIAELIGEPRELDF